MWGDGDGVGETGVGTGDGVGGGPGDGVGGGPGDGVGVNGDGDGVTGVGIGDGPVPDSHHINGDGQELESVAPSQHSPGVGI